MNCVKDSCKLKGNHASKPVMQIRDRGNPDVLVPKNSVVSGRYTPMLVSRGPGVATSSSARTPSNEAAAGALEEANTPRMIRVRIVRNGVLGCRGPAVDGSAHRGARRVSKRTTKIATPAPSVRTCVRALSAPAPPRIESPFALKGCRPVSFRRRACARRGAPAGTRQATPRAWRRPRSPRPRARCRARGRPWSPGSASES